MQQPVMPALCIVHHALVITPALGHDPGILGCTHLTNYCVLFYQKRQPCNRAKELHGKYPQPGPTWNEIPRSAPNTFLKMCPDPGPILVRSGETQGFGLPRRSLISVTIYSHIPRPASDVKPINWRILPFYIDVGRWWASQWKAWMNPLKDPHSQMQPGREGMGLVMRVAMTSIVMVSMNSFREWKIKMKDLKSVHTGILLHCVRGMVKNLPLLRRADNNGCPWVHAVMCDNTYSDVW